MFTPDAPLSDAAFVALFDLEHPHFAGTKATAKGAPAEAAKAILEALDARPLQAYTNRKELLEIGAALAADQPALLKKFRRIVERARSEGAAKPADAFSGSEHYLRFCDFDLEVRDYARRGRGWYHLALLQAVTGEPEWTAQASQLLRALPSFAPDPRIPSAAPDAPFQPLLPWHPQCPPGWDCLGVAHVLENMSVALPLFWPGLSLADRRFALAYLAYHADLFHRGMEEEPAYNIPFHGLVAAWSVAALFPELRGAARWKAQMDECFAEGGRYAVYPYQHPDGFFSEHLGYQVVNQTLLTRCFLLYERAWGGQGAPERLRRQVEAGFAFAAGTLLPDGSSFLLGDHQARSGHEHELDYHEGLHLGAALFNRPDWKARAGGCRGTWPEGILPFLMGAPGYRRWRSMPEPELDRRTHASTAFTEAGFFHLRSGKGVEGACHGLLSAALSPNHAHHDCLGVTVFGLGRELLSDSGFLGYGSSDLAKQQGPAAHAVCRLGHLNPSGARHELPQGVTHKLFQASACGRIQVALAEHNLYANYLSRRALILCLPEDPDSGNALWLVWDRMVYRGTADGAEPPASVLTLAPARVTETLFPLHAPGGSARVAERSGWSCHTPQDRLRRPGEGQPLPLTSAEGCVGIERADNDANLQVTALVGEAPGATSGVEISEGFCGHFVTPVARPVLTFKWRGRIPHEAAYILLPFRGLAETAPWSVEGWCARAEEPGSFEARIRAQDASLRKTWPQEIGVRVSGLAAATSGPARIELRVGDEREAALEFTVRP